MTKTGTLFLIPNYLSDGQDTRYVAPLVREVIRNTRYFLAENIRTARRYISSLQLDLDISSLNFELLNKQSTHEEMDHLMKPLLGGHDMGIISEAGLPAIADPGNLAVSFAHQRQIKVVPLPGFSSILGALISSGFNGQQFVFHGYLPIEKGERALSLRKMESELMKTSYTHIFMETPYRNQALLQDIYAHCSPQLLLSIASDISGPSEMIRTMPVKSWKISGINIEKIPTIFCLGLYPT